MHAVKRGTDKLHGLAPNLSQQQLAASRLRFQKREETQSMFRLVYHHVGVQLAEPRRLQQNVNTLAMQGWLQVMLHNLC